MIGRWCKTFLYYHYVVINCNKFVTSDKFRYNIWGMIREERDETYSIQVFPSSLPENVKAIKCKECPKSSNQ